MRLLECMYTYMYLNPNLNCWEVTKLTTSSVIIN